jgi:Skp family chaperone for outer membrane proteins
MTISKHFLAISLAASLFTSASAQESKLKVATVDLQQLFTKYYRTEELQKELNADKSEIEKTNNDRLVRIREIQGSLEKLKKQIEDPSVNDTKKQALVKDFQMQEQEGIALDRERREFVERRQRALQESVGQRTQTIIADLRKLVDAESQKQNFDIVLDKSQNTTQTPVVLFSKDSFDITAIILKDLNKEAPAKEAAPEKKEEK